MVDTHCHLNLFKNHEELDAIINRARNIGITEILVPGIDIKSSRQAIHLSELYPEIFAAVGMHPNSASNWDSKSYSEFLSFTKHEKVVAIGEIGLDYYRQYTPKNRQIQVFNKQLELAEQSKLPIIIHSRDALEDAMNIVMGLKNGTLPIQGVFHSFDGSAELIQQAVDLDFMISFTGVITYKNADDLRKSALHTPLSHLLIETDAPYLSPHPKRGKTNEPSYIFFTAERIAEMFERKTADIAGITASNSDKIFSWRKA